jgi:predicted AAA+ superfamily ATPase
MVPRRLTAALTSALAEAPAVALLGPPQVGKTTLALELVQTRPAVYLDLESETDRAKLAEPKLYLAQHADQLVILDEIQRTPQLFSCLRGGFPKSLLADSDAASLRWRVDFIRTCLERDIPQLGPRIPAETLRRLWTMLAHSQGGLLNAAAFARALAVDGKTVASYLDLLVDLLLVRRLAPWHRNVRKRLVKSPKVFVRDSGLVHARLGVSDREAKGRPDRNRARSTGEVERGRAQRVPRRHGPTRHREENFGNARIRVQDASGRVVAPLLLYQRIDVGQPHLNERREGVS